MGFEIPKITNAKLKEIAEKADQGNGYIESVASDGGKELTIFMSEAEKAGFKREVVINSLAEAFVNDEEIHENDVTDSLKINTNNTQASTIAKPDTKVTKSDKKDFINTMEKLGKTANNPRELFERIKSQYIGNVPERLALFADFQKVYSLIPTYESKDDVEKIHDEAKKQLKADGKWNKFTKGILEEFEKAAKKDQINKEFKKQKEQFDKILSTVEDSEAGQEYIAKEGGQNYKAARKIAKRELKENENWDGKYSREAYKKLKNYTKVQSERVNDAATIAKAAGKETPTRDISYSKTDLNLHHEEIALNKSNADKREKESATLTEKEIKKGLKGSTAKKLRAYMYNHQNQDGTFDLSNLLTDAKSGINRYTGSDETVNRNYDDPLLSELEWVRKGLKHLTGEDFCRKEAKDLVDFLGKTNQKRNRNFKDALAKNGIPMLASGAVTGGVYGVYADQTVELIVKLNAGQKLEDIAKFAANAKIEQLSANTVRVSVHQVANLKGLCAGAGALTSLAIGMLLDLIMGMDNNEKTCLNIEELRAYKDIKELETHVKEIYPDKAEALITLAKVFIEKGKTLDQFYDFLTEKAGAGSVMNADECFGTQIDAAKQKESVQQTVNTPVVNCDEQFKDGENGITATHEYKVEYRDTWSKMVLAKYPCLAEKYGITKANEMMRKALCYDEDGNFDQSKWAKIRSGWMPKVINFPDEISGCKYEDNKVEKVSVQELNSGTKRYKGTIGSIGNGRKYSTDTTYTNSCHPGVIGKGKNRQEAEADFLDQLVKAK